MLEAFDAELLLLDRERRLVHAGDRDERREVGALARQRFGELEAGARRSGVGIDRIVEHAEAVIVAHAFVERAHVGDLADFQRQPQRVERRAPYLAVGLGAADDQQAVGLLAAVLGERVGLVGGGAGALEQQHALALVGRADLLDGRAPSRSQPALSPGAAATSWPSSTMPLRKSLLLKAASSFAADLRERLAGSASLALDLRFKLDRGFGEIRPLERLVGGDGQGRRENGRKGDERGKDAGADEHEHGRDPPDRSASPTERATVQAEF